MSKNLIFNTAQSQDVRGKLKAGITKLANAVRVTLGPSGRVVMYERDGGDPAITKDGVTVAKQVELEDKFENMGAQMVRQATAKTAAVAGDGTTTATIYAEAIYEAGMKGITTGANPQEVKRGVDAAAKRVIDQLSSMARPVVDLEQIKQVAVCSSNQDYEIGEMIAEALNKVGKDGVVTIEEGQAMETAVSVIDGLQFPRGYLSPQFATNPESMMCEYDDPYLLITDEKIADLKSLLGILEMLIKKLGAKMPLVLIADEFSDDCLSMLLLNRLKSQLNIVAVKAPGFGDRKRLVLEDIAIATGGIVLGRNSGVDLGLVSDIHLGRCKKIKIDRDSTTILEGGGDPAAMEARLALLRGQLNSMPGDYDRERVQERLARLTGGIAVISVGGATEVEVREKKDRIDDALHACKAAIEEGILPGGAVAAIHASYQIVADGGFVSPSEDYRIGVDALLKALESPLRQIAINTGQDDGVVVNGVRSNAANGGSPDYGFDAVQKQYGNMIEFGIIVPTKVERVALQNAASVAGLLLTTDCMISINKDDKGPAISPFPSLMG